MTTEQTQLEVLENLEEIPSELQNNTQKKEADTAKSAVEAPKEEEKKKKKRTATVPQTELDILTVAKDAIKNWDEVEMPIRWITKADFQTALNSYNEHIDVIISHKGSRSPQVKSLSNLDAEINLNLGKIKGALTAKYGKNIGMSHYTDFGIERDNKRLILPSNRDQRLKALQTLVTAIDNYELELYNFGKDYWQNVLDQYTLLSEEIRDKSGDISQSVSEKNNEKNLIVKTLNAMIKGLQMNYPDDYPQMMRKWGFQKDKY